MRILGFRLRPYLYFFASISIALGATQLADASYGDFGHNPESTPSGNLKQYGQNAGYQGEQQEQDMNDNGYQKGNDPGAGRVGNGTANGQPPGHGQMRGGSAAAREQGEQVNEKAKKDQQELEHSANVTGGTTKCMWQAKKLTPQSGVDEQPYVKLKPSTAQVEGSRRQTSAGNAAEQAIGNSTNTPKSGVNQKQFQVQTGMTPTGATLNNAMKALTDQFRQQIANPQVAAKAAKGMNQTQNAQNSDNQGNKAKADCQNAFECMKLPLINVANENAASPCSSSAPFKDESNVIWMVQQMYHKCYVPMAVLFLLPGAVLTQVKSLVAFQILGSQDEDTSSPFIGIFRAMMAVFLIPATQLAVSYCIDIGNALTDPVARQVQVETLMKWVEEQAYSTDPKNNDNTIKKITGKQTMGKLMGTSAKKAVQERQSDLTVGIQNMFNSINAMMGQGLEVLNGFQLVMMCYLFLLGPIAAALYAWPAAVGRDLFKKAFSSWLDGVIVLSLWKFWWCIVLLCMAVRLQEGGIDPTSQYEMYYYTAFMGILVMVPFQPFEFRPGEIVSHVLEKAQQGGGGGGGGGGGKGGGGKGGGGSGGGGGNPQGPNTTGNDNSGQAQTKTAGQADSGLKGGVAGDHRDSGSNAGQGKSDNGRIEMAGDFEDLNSGGNIDPGAPPTAIT